MEKHSAALALMLIVSSTGLSPTATANDSSHRASVSDVYVAGSLCRKPDQILFSCPLAKSSKIVSICAAGMTAPHRFYYAFGTSDAIELTYPAESGSTNAFKRTLLMYPGGTGAYAYSFVQEDFKYVIYAISGAGLDTGGIVIKRENALRALATLECAQNKLEETSNESLFDETLKWPIDSELHGHGLPTVN
jgi:hypothetical protein